MKARKVKRLDPDGAFIDNARRIVRVRLDELRSFGPGALDPRAVTTSHDMRIAAKRLRYVLELSEPVFGDAAVRGAKQARKLQDLLGEIHDCDEMLPLVDRQLERLRAADSTTVRERARADAADLDPATVKQAPHRRHYRGLEALRTYLVARRDAALRSVHAGVVALEREHFGELLLAGLE